ncbi:phage tail tape measure protein [Citrobacter portucalensis]|uniref:phage tail tape measure protein n=1 Tax=Citrobacter portucalensis TaxID=1639133 RepID=UPI00226B95A3|nr:phage tail tape measure protein [Citrobacter portucalensis]MCX8983525.1 phage tail tape measure protein [Citrobacter portucalensis]
MSAQLDFTLSLINKITRPLKQAEAGIKGFASKTSQAFSNIAVGGAGLFGVGMGIKAVLQPAHEMNMALGEVRSLGIANDALNNLRDTALQFSIDYGTSASDFVRSSYDIAGAISGLSGNDLAAFTNASGILAKATKADAGTITSYMGTMYGIFSKDAEAMGNAKWVDDIASKTAYAVNIFKSDGVQMAGAFTALGAAAQSAGAGVSEQFGILGTLQATMSGSEAGTKYKAFLAGVGGAQKTLGLSFTDAAGRMKSTPEILDLIRGKYGDLSKVANADLVKKAFGSDEAVAMIKLLINNTDTLKSNITAIGNTKGLDYVVDMAKNMIDPWERLSAYMDAIRIVIGNTLLPTIYPLLNGVADTGKQFMRWQELFPHITKSIGLVVMAILGAAAAGATLNIMLGVGRLMMIAFRATWIVITLPVKLFTAALWLCRGAMTVFQATLVFIRGAMLAYSIATGAAGIATNLLLWPVLAVIAAIVALGVGAYLLVTHWDSVTAAFSAGWQSIAEGWLGICDYFSAVSPMAAIQGVVSGIGELFSGLWDSVKVMFSNTWSWIIDKLNMIPGISIDAGSALPAASAVGPDLLTGGTTQGVGRNGVLASGAVNGGQTTIDQRRTYGSTTIQVQQMPTPGQMREWQETQG